MFISTTLEVVDAIKQRWRPLDKQNSHHRDMSLLSISGFSGTPPNMMVSSENHFGDDQHA